MHRARPPKFDAASGILAVCLLRVLRAAAASCVPPWPGAALDLPAPSASVHYQALGPRQLCENCTEHTRPLVVAVDDARDFFAVCRCAAGWKRDAASGACTPCASHELCPHLSDVAFDAGAACTALHSVVQQPPAGLEAYWDPVADAPCIEPRGAYYAPAIPFYFGPDSHIAGAPGLGPVRCPDGQRPWASGRDRARGLVWERDTGPPPTTAALNIRVLSERLLLTEDDLRGLARIGPEDFVRRAGQVFRSVHAPPCVLCGRGFYCTGGAEHACADNASEAIGARSDAECSAPGPAARAPPPCPAAGLRLRPAAPCVCAGALAPVPRPDLAAGFACVEDDHGLDPGAALRVVPRAPGGRTARGGAVVVALLRENRSVALHTLASTLHVRVPGLGADDVLLGATSQPLAVGILNSARSILRVDAQGSVQTLAPPLPARAARPDRVQELSVARNATLPARWVAIAPGAALLPSAQVSNDTALGELAARGVRGALTPGDYASAGIGDVPRSTAVRAADGAWYVPNASAPVYRTATIITGVILQGGTGGPPWVLTGHAAAFDADRELGAVVYAYYAPADNASTAPNATVTARCWHGAAVADDVPTATAGAAARCAPATFTVTWGPGRRACLNPATCAWEAYYEDADAALSPAGAAPTCVLTRGEHAALAAAPLVVHGATHVYELARPSLEDMAAGRVFGTRTARRDGSAYVGWWTLHRAPRPPSACLGFLEQWFDGRCVRCAYNQNCTPAALARSPTALCSVQRGALRAQTDVCPCPPGFAPDVGGDCAPCNEEPANGFCAHGLHYTCPPDSRTDSPAHTACVCVAGWTRTDPRGACHPCPLDHYCARNSTGPQRCPDGTGTPGGAVMASASDCVPMPGLLAGATPCSRGTFKSTYADAQNCTPCAANRTTLYEGAAHAGACLCRAGFRARALADAACVPCPPGYACPLGASPRWCTADAQEEIAAHTYECQCMPGFFRAAAGACVPCLRGFFCESGRIERCPLDMTSPSGAAARTDCTCERADLVPLITNTSGGVTCACRANAYRVPESGACQACPAHSTAPAGSHSPLDCACDPGFTPAAGGCVACPRGSFCAGRMGQQPCPPGTFGPVPGLAGRDQCLACDTAIEKYGGGGRADPAMCWGEFLAVQAADDARVALDAHHADVLVDMDARDVPGFRTQLAAATTTRFQAGTATRDMLTSIAPDPAHPTVARVRVHVDMLPDFVTRAVHRIFATAGAGTYLHTLTRESHVLSYAIASAVLFCHFVRDVAVEVAPASTRTAILCRPRFDGPGATAVFAEARALAHWVMNTSTPVLDASEVQAHPETALYLWNLRRAMGLWQEQDIAVFPHGERSLVVTKGRHNVTTPGPETLAYWASGITAAACEPIASALLDSCTSATIPHAAAGFCAFCPRDTFRDTASGNCLPCTPPEAMDGACLFGGRSCCGTHDAVCLARDDASGYCLNGRHEATEACDPTDRRTALYKCCTFTCDTLQPGYYAQDGQCAAVCGDGVVAQGTGDLPREECDNTADMQCDMSTCRVRRV